MSVTLTPTAFECHQPPENDESGYWCGIIRPRSIMLYFHKSHKSHSHKSLTIFKSNFKKKNISQTISPQGRKKIKNAIQNLYYLARPKKVWNPTTKSHFTFRCSMFTATLSSEQIHSDLEIKRDILRPFLDRLRKTWGVDRYIWRLEKQENGNTHFHIVLDVFIPHQVLRRKWNYYQEKLGYVSRYSKYQKEWHKDGFRVRPWLLDYWPLESQKKAYTSGLANDYRDPNSTDIHSFRNINDTVSYISKYITKNEENQEETPLPSDQDSTDLSVCQGRIWAISESLSKIIPARFICTSKSDQELTTIRDKAHPKIIDFEFGYIYLLQVDTIWRFHCMELMSIWTTSGMPPPS